jgi:hypothetical protein
MPLVKRLSAYLLGFVVLVSLLAASGASKYIDYAAYKSLYLNDASHLKLHSAITLIDIPYTTDINNTFSLKNYRLRVADLLNVIIAQENKPDAVILDMYISNEQGALEALQKAMQQILDLGVNLYVVFNTEEWHRKEYEILRSEHAPNIYQMLDNLYLHTNFTNKLGVLSYSSELVKAVPGGEISIEALTQRVARDHRGDNEELRPTTRDFVLALGNESEVDLQTYRFSHKVQNTSGGKFSRYVDNSETPEEVSFDMDSRIILVGSLAKDKVDFVAQAGPKLVAWALDDQLSGNKNARQPLNDSGRILGQILFFALLTVLLFAALFKYVKALQTKPLVIAGLSALLSTAMLYFLLLDRLEDNKVSPIALTLFAIGIAAFLAWQFARKFLVTGIVEGSGKYDVFISYSRKESDWVINSLYEPLRALRKADGSKLVIFFDRDEIGIGEPFTAKYMWAIVNSKLFLPVFSDGYYEKPHCRNEVDLAYKRYVGQKLAMLPIAHSSDAVPEIYTHMNYVSVKDNPTFIEGIIKEILAGQQQNTSPAA